MTKKQKGFFIPMEIFTNPELSLIEKCLLSEISALDLTPRHCYSTNKYFAEKFDLTKGRVSQIITSLKNIGCIYIHYKKKGKQTIERNINIVSEYKNKVKTNKVKKSNEYKETFIYFIELKNKTDHFIKIGVSNFLSKRYSNYINLGYDVTELFTEKFYCRSDALQSELNYHKQFIKSQYIPVIKFGGYTECFNLSIKDFLNK